MTLPSPDPTTALLLVNLGTPEAPTAQAISRYLREFLSDRRVVQIPPLLWQPLLRGLILPLRSRRVAHKYAQVWMEGGSPLAVLTRRLAEAVATRMPGVRVAHAMRYGAPSVRDALAALQAQGATQVLVLPLYPQYSTTTTASVGDAVARAQQTAAVPIAAIRLIDDYHVDPQWVSAVAGSIRAHWDTHGRGERLLLSFHGLPQRLVKAGDPYARQCEASTAAIAAALGLARDEVLLTFQSRFGREAWLQPYTQPTLETMARAGVRSVDVACPGFAVDCLETLEEIAMENAKAFRDAAQDPKVRPAAASEPSALGLPPTFHYIPCLNDAPAHADALALLARRELEAWWLGG